MAHALNLTLTRPHDASARSTREVRELEGGEGGISHERPTRSRPPSLSQLAFWLSTSHQSSSTWVGSEIVPISPMEPTPGSPWERKVWKDHSLPGFATIKSGR